MDRSRTTRFLCVARQQSLILRLPDQDVLVGRALRCRHVRSVQILLLDMLDSAAWTSCVLDALDKVLAAVRALNKSGRWIIDLTTG